jgi:predicted GIY-YIG superfamily endonuclease
LAKRALRLALRSCLRQRSMGVLQSENGARAMFYVYIIRSVNQPDQTYIGFTRDLKQRLITHNQDRSPHTAKFSPWRIEFYCAFKQEDKALAFERYLKSHSGKAFASKRLF